MKSLAELAAIREKMQSKVVIREGAGNTRVVVGMATCGIAAGARPVLNAFVETVQEAVKADDKVQLVGFGTFEARERAAREGINPLTKEKIQIAASKVPAFKAGKALKDVVNG